MHYLIIIAIIAIIVIIQFSIYRNTIKKINTFKEVFAPSENDYEYSNTGKFARSIKESSDKQLLTKLEKDGYDLDDFYTIEENEEGIEVFVFNRDLAIQCLLEEEKDVQGISSSHYNPIFDEIKNAINNYLANNKGAVSDFHLMKDIVDRNCDAKEEEINTQIPVPLYLGLMGTMIGILVGLGYLWISGDLSALLNAGDSTNSGAKGVTALLGGVALAMISSIMGILLTTSGSMKAKSAKANTEREKHVFLSWMQVNLLPKLSNDTAQTLERMSQNLASFNNMFSKNTSELGQALSQVNEATKIQKQLIEEVGKLADKNISKQNLELYSALRSSSQEIATLGEFLRDSNLYLANVRDLNDKLDKNEQRTQAFEEMVVFFKKELTQIEQRKEAINKAVGEVDSRLDDTFRLLSQHSTDNMESFQVALGTQQAALQNKLNEIQIIVDELKNLTTIKDSISKFEKATAEQNRKIDKLAENIRQLAEVKAKAEGVTQWHSEQLGERTPIWKKVVIWSSTIIGVVVVLSLIIANWDHIYSFLFDILRF